MFGFGKINMGFIGTGYMAGKMAATVNQLSGVRPYAVASRDLERALGFGRDAGFRKAYGSYTELLEDRKVDLVYIATPGYTHYEIIKQCIIHGKNVLCETPFTLSFLQAEELFQMAEKRNLLLVDAMYTRFLPLYRQISDTLDSGVIGRPTLLTANIAYDIEHITRLQDSEHGGVMSELGIYLLNFASMFMGDEVCEIVTSTIYTSSRADLQDTVLLRYADGRQSVLTCSMESNGESRGMIQCTKGYIVVENIKSLEAATVYDMTGTKIASFKRPKQKSSYEHEIKTVQEAVKSEVIECTQMSHRQTISLLHMLEYILNRISHGRPASLPEDEVTVPVQNDSEMDRDDSTAEETELEQG